MIERQPKDLQIQSAYDKREPVLAAERVKVAGKFRGTVDATLAKFADFVDNRAGLPMVELIARLPEGRAAAFHVSRMGEASIGVGTFGREGIDESTNHFYARDNNGTLRRTDMGFEEGTEMFERMFTVFGDEEGIVKDLSNVTDISQVTDVTVVHDLTEGINTEKKLGINHIAVSEKEVDSLAEVLETADVPDMTMKDLWVSLLANDEIDAPQHTTKNREVVAAFRETVKKTLDAHEGLYTQHGETEDLGKTRGIGMRGFGDGAEMITYVGESEKLGPKVYTQVIDPTTEPPVSVRLDYIVEDGNTIGKAALYGIKESDGKIIYTPHSAQDAEVTPLHLLDLKKYIHHRMPDK